MKKDNLEIKAIIQSNSIFKSTGPEALDELVAGAEFILFTTGDYIYKIGEVSDSVFLLLNGKVEVFDQQYVEGQKADTYLEKGELIGASSIITGGKRTRELRAHEETQAIQISREAINKAINKDTTAIDGLVSVVKKRVQTNQVTEALKKLFSSSGEKSNKAIEQLTKSAEWIHLSRSRLLIEEGDEADSLYVVVSGRLQAYKLKENGEEKILGEIGIGDTVGEMALLEDDKRTAHIKALRDCELARFNREELMVVVSQHPEFLIAIAKNLMTRLRDGFSPISLNKLPRSIAIFPASKWLNVNSFATNLATEIKKYGTLRQIDHSIADADLNLDTQNITVEHSHNGLLSAWLDEQELRHDYILLVTDAEATPWSKRCLQQADLVLLVADSKSDSKPGKAEVELIENQKVSGQVATSLCLIHATDIESPSGTSQWLKYRQLESHYHIKENKQDDIGRVARLLTGNAIGVVLGGGGARGAAHIGVLKALRELSVPVDMICGTSSGGGIAAQFAMGWDDEKIIESNIDGFVNNNPFKSYTLPILSIVDRRKMDWVAQRMFADLQVEDLWTDFFCVSCNLHKGKAEIHRKGSLWKAVRATSSLPGIAVPVIKDGALLVDGGIVDNLPGCLIRQFMTGKVIVVDVSPDEGMEVDLNYEDIPGSWKLLWSRLNPFSKSIEFPSLVEVLLRTVTVSSYQARKQALENADIVLYPPVEKYGMLEFTQTKQIAEDAYHYTMDKLDKADSELKTLIDTQANKLT